MANQTKKTKDDSKLKKTMVLFIATFFVTLFFLIFVIQNFSPQIDTEIVENADGETTTAQEAGESFQRFVDDRLKWIQQEDNDPSAKASKQQQEEPENNAQTANENPYPDSGKKEELVRQHSQYNSIEINEAYKEAKESINIADETERQTIATQKPMTQAPPIKREAAPLKMTKVFVGNYSTMEQAISTQNRLMDSGLNLTPFIREINGAYTVQVGSFSTQAKALDLINKLNGSGFYGRTVQE